MDYNNFLIEAAISLNLVDATNYYTISDDLSEITSVDDTVSVSVNDAVINRAIYLSHLYTIRSTRNQLIAESDWMILPDSPLSAEDKQIWIDYRQALRDCTNDLIEGQEDEFEFPTSPLASNT